MDLAYSLDMNVISFRYERGIYYVHKPGYYQYE